MQSRVDVQEAPECFTYSRQLGLSSFCASLWWASQNFLRSQVYVLTPSRNGTNSRTYLDNDDLIQLLARSAVSRDMRPYYIPVDLKRLTNR